MQPSKKYLKWCMGQSKGIQVVKESKNLQHGYMERSKTSLKSMEVNVREGIDDWAVSAGYYARYFAIYALLRRIGVKCEIHDCTVAVFEYLFADQIPPLFFEDLGQAKSDRIDAQYYTGVMQTNMADVIRNTKRFVLKIEEIIDGLNQPRIQAAREKLAFLSNPH